MTWQQKLRATLAAGGAVRLGEAAVISRRVHLSEPHRPERIFIAGLDAGQTMYHRRRRGEILHLDLSHAVGELDHRLVAAAIREVWQGVPALHPVSQVRLGDLCEYTDIQTGTGGGCITGTLTFGRRLGLMNSHRNHIHLATLLADSQVEWLLPLVAALERVAVSQRLEPRRITGLELWSADDGTSSLDFSDYADQFDTRLKGNGAAGGSSLRPGRNSADATGDRSRGGLADRTVSPGQPAWETPRGAAGRAAPPDAPPAGHTGDGPRPDGAAAPLAEGNHATTDAWVSLQHEQNLQEALALSRRFGSPEEMRRLLEHVQQPASTPPTYLLKLLEEAELINREGRQTVLTPKGQALAVYLQQHFRELKLRFRKRIRRMPVGQPVGEHPTGAVPSSRVRYGAVRKAAPVPAGEALGELAVPETVLAALRRTQAAAGAGAVHAPALHFVRSDLHQQLRSGRQNLNICLLIDASASMAGRRILAAKYLARHLLLSTRDRVAVVAFQERDVRGYVPFTRDWSQLEAGLARIQPMGLTPLAHGLEQSLTLIRQARVRRPLLLLVTDGIPTVPRWTIDPLVDALQAAKWVRQARVPFACIGLQPSRRYLQELANCAGGTLTVVDELHEEALVGFAHQQRVQHQAR